MMCTDLDAEPEAELLQRRWFAALTATRRLEAECLQLLNVLRCADEAWRHARTQLAEFEALTEALGEQLARQDEAPADSGCGVLDPAVAARRASADAALKMRRRPASRVVRYLAVPNSSKCSQP
jgi:hypothetical protein